MKLLILTNHAAHSSQNSLYPIVRSMLKDERISEIRVASKGTRTNQAFFAAKAEFFEFSTPALLTLIADEFFDFNDDSAPFGCTPEDELTRTPLDWADIVWLRIPHPVPNNWFTFLRQAFAKTPIINRPEGILKTTSKAYLAEVPELCAPIKLCEKPEDVIAFVRTPQADGSPFRNAVLKPLEGYGGQGILRIIDGQVELEGQKVPLEHWPAQPESNAQYLAMEYLPLVSEGDKRIVVIGDQVIGAALRVPAPGNWLANVSQGGKAYPAEISFAERRIIDTLMPKMKALGVVMYGIDTLMGNQGERVLSEINTMSIGGLLNLSTGVDQSADQLAATALLNAMNDLLHE